jgi:hypothetical protein
MFGSVLVDEAGLEDFLRCHWSHFLPAKSFNGNFVCYKEINACIRSYVCVCARDCLPACLPCCHPLILGVSLKLFEYKNVLLVDD